MAMVVSTSPKRSARTAPLVLTAAATPRTARGAVSRLCQETKRIRLASITRSAVGPTAFHRAVMRVPRSVAAAVPMAAGPMAAPEGPSRAKANPPIADPEGADEAVGGDIGQG